MVKLFALSLSIVTSISSVTASAQTYRAFETNTAIPGHLVGLNNSLSVTGNIRFSPVAIQAGPATLYFHPDVAALMENIRTTKGLQGHSEFMSCDIPSIESLRGETNKEIRKIVSKLDEACGKLRRPELLYAQSKVSEPGFFGLTSIEKVIETAVTPLVVTGTTISFHSAQTTSLARAGMLRIRYSDLKRLWSDALSMVRDQSSRGSFSASTRSSLVSLKNEVETKLGFIMAHNNAGKAAYQADAAAVQARGASRDWLPNDNMSDAERRALSIYLYGLLWRFRGGGFVDGLGTQGARMYFAQQPFERIAELNGMNSVADLDMFSRLASRGWGQWMDMGRTPGQEDWLSDLINMTSRGVYQLEGTIGRLAAYGHDTARARAMSLQFGACYLYAYENLPGLTLGTEHRAPLRGFYDGPTAWAETCVGTVFAIALADTLLSTSN